MPMAKGLDDRQLKDQRRRRNFGELVDHLVVAHDQNRRYLIDIHPDVFRRRDILDHLHFDLHKPTGEDGSKET